MKKNLNRLWEAFLNKIPQRQIEDQLLKQALAGLSNSTGLSVVSFKRTKEGGPGGMVGIDNGNGKWEYGFEVKNHLTNQALGAVMAQVASVRKDQGHCVLVAPYINPVQAEKLRQGGIEFLDGAGNAFFRNEGLYVWVTGRKNKILEAVPRARAFNPTGLRLIFALLCLPELENKSYRELAQKSGISLGAVGWVLSDLKRLGYLVEYGTRKWKFIRKKELLKRWVTAYPEQLRPKLLVGRYRAKDGENWWKKAKLPRDTAFWGGEVGAGLVTNFLHPQAAIIYAETNLPKFQAGYGLRRDPDGEMEILQKFWSFDGWETRSAGIVPPLLLYSDLLMTAEERNLETAELIYEQYLTRLIE